MRSLLILLFGWHMQMMQYMPTCMAWWPFLFFFFSFFAIWVAHAMGNMATCMAWWAFSFFLFSFWCWKPVHPMSFVWDGGGGWHVFYASYTFNWDNATLFLRDSSICWEPRLMKRKSLVRIHNPLFVNMIFFKWFFFYFLRKNVKSVHIVYLICN